jgi:hypothetical protein
MLTICMLEPGIINRNKEPGTSTGLTTERLFLQGGTHIFSLPSQVRGMSMTGLDGVSYESA